MLGYFLAWAFSTWLNWQIVVILWALIQVACLGKNQSLVRMCCQFSSVCTTVVLLVLLQRSRTQMWSTVAYFRYENLRKLPLDLLRCKLHDLKIPSGTGTQKLRGVHIAYCDFLTSKIDSFNALVFHSSQYARWAERAIQVGRWWWWLQLADTDKSNKY